MPQTPQWALDILAAQSTETRDALKAKLADPATPVLLCCNGGTCVSVESSTECPATHELKECDHGITNSDGTATCFDDQEHSPP